MEMGPQRRLGIYVGFNSPSIIRFLEPTTGDLFIARFADCHFNETMFPSIGTPKIEMAAKQKPVKVFSWNEKIYLNSTQELLSAKTRCSA